ncbi:MAG: hypothetical protein WAN43_15670 [Rhodomicrobium sp.]|jgi:hypothetical protein
MAMALLKVLLVVAFFIGIGYWIAVYDLPNRNYYWIAFEVVIAILLIPVAIGNLKRVLGGK